MLPNHCLLLNLILLLSLATKFPSPAVAASAIARYLVPQNYVKLSEPVENLTLSDPRLWTSLGFTFDEADIMPAPPLTSTEIASNDSIQASSPQPQIAPSTTNEPSASSTTEPVAATPTETELDNATTSRQGMPAPHDTQNVTEQPKLDELILVDYDLPFVVRQFDTYECGGRFNILPAANVSCLATNLVVSWPALIISALVISRLFASLAPTQGTTAISLT